MGQMQLYCGKIGTDNNMGAVRYLLAFAVLMAHFNIVFGTQWWFPVSSYYGVGGFFTLSGFLIYGSYMRSGGLMPFLARRARKIVPPYFFIVLACAFLLCLTVPSGGRADYFSVEWVKYLAANLSFLNFLQPSLPGVFGGYPVNGSLWTIKIEWMLYLSVPVFVWLLSRKWMRHPVALIVLIYIFSGLYRLLFCLLYERTSVELYDILSRQFFGQLCFFYSGVLIYMLLPWFRKIKWSAAAVALVLIIAGRWIPGFSFFVEPMAIAVVVMALSLSGGLLKKLNVNNFSYEIYLFHMPVLLLVHWYQPALGCTDGAAFAISVAAVCVLSVLCWFLLDKPLLHRKTKLTMP